MVQFGQVYFMACGAHPAYPDSKFVGGRRAGRQMAIAWIGKQETVCPAEQIGSPGIVQAG